MIVRGEEGNEECSEPAGAHKRLKESRQWWACASRASEGGGQRVEIGQEHLFQTWTVALAVLSALHLLPPTGVLLGFGARNVLRRLFFDLSSRFSCDCVEFVCLPQQPTTSGCTAIHCVVMNELLCLIRPLRIAACVME
jgi:hypothetical protein